MQPNIKVEGCNVYSVLTKCAFSKYVFRGAISTLVILIRSCESDLVHFFVALTSSRYNLMHFFSYVKFRFCICICVNFLLKMSENYKSGNRNVNISLDIVRNT